MKTEELPDISNQGYVGEHADILILSHCILFDNIKIYPVIRKRVNDRHQTNHVFKKLVRHPLLNFAV